MASEAPTRPVPAAVEKPTTDDANPRSPREAVDLASEATSGDQVGPRTAQLAADWFLDNDSLQQEAVAAAIVPLNVAPAGVKEHIVDFKVQVLDREKIRAIRKECTTRHADGTEEIDDMESNLRMAVEALLDPPIRTDPAYRVVRGQTYLDPADALKARLAHKPGLIDQLAGKVVEISGYNNADAKEVKAAGNS